MFPRLTLTMPIVARLFVAWLPFLATEPAWAAATDDERPPFPHEVSDLSADSRVVYGELESGLRYAVMHNATPRGTASIRLRFAAGSLDESEDTQGMAHFLEHMAFNGSKKVPEGELMPRLERLGLSFGADTNAHTGFDETVYKLNLPTVDEPVLDESFMLMREVAMNLTLDPDAIDRERGIILSEKRSRNTPGLRRLIAQMAFFGAGSGIAEQLPIGRDETIQSIDAKQMRAFYEAHYHPRRAFLVFVGDVAPDDVIGRIRDSFADWRPRDEPPSIARAGSADNEPGRASVFYDPDSMTNVTLAVLRPFERKDDSSKTREQRLLQDFGDKMLAFRLTRLAREPGSPILRGYAYSGAYQDIAEIAAVQVGGKPGMWGSALQAAEQELRRALNYGFTEREFKDRLEEYRSNLAVRAAQSETKPTNTRFGGLADSLVRSYGDGRVFTHPKDELQWFDGISARLSLERVEAAFREQWNGGKGISVFLEDRETPQTSAAAVRDALAQSSREDVAPPDEPDNPAFAYEPPGAAGTIVQESFDESIDTHFYKFENNVRLNVRQTDFKDNEVLVRVHVGDGALSLPAKDEGLRRLALNVLSNGGLEDYTDLQIGKALARRGISNRTFFSKDSDSIMLSGAAKPEEIPFLVEVLASLVESPGLRREAAERYKQKIRAWYDTHDSTARGVATREIPRLLRSGDTRFGFGSLDNFLAASYETAREWLSDQLDDGLIEITVVGDIDRQEVIALVATTFGALEERNDSRGTYPAMTRLKFPMELDEVATYWHQGEPDDALLRMYWPAPDGFDADTVRRMQVLRAVLQNRLVEEIRERAAAAYSPGVAVHGDTNSPGYGYIGVSMELSPDSIPATMERIDAIARDLGRGAISADEFVRALQPIAEDFDASVQTNGYWLDVLSDAQTDARGLARHKSARAGFDGMTRAEVRSVARAVFGPGYRVAVQALPSTLRTVVEKGQGNQGR